MAKSQEHRQIAVGTPLGDDVLMLTRMLGSERLGRPFELELHLISEDYQVRFEDIIGQNVTVRLELGEKKTRYFNGYVRSFTQTPGQGRFAHYRATVVPWLWFLTRTSDCRIFQKMTVPNIIKQVFRDGGFSDFEDALNGNYREWEYCVQYRETNFNFVSRLMEQEGIYYYFKHEDGKHTLVLVDSPAAHQPYEGYEEILYRPPNEAASTNETISTWVVSKKVLPGMYSLNDFDFKNTRKDLHARAKLVREHDGAELEIYDYPGEYSERTDGESYARTRIEELQAEYMVAEADSDVRGICTGCTFTLTEYPREDQNREYLITSADYDVCSEEYESGHRHGGQGNYSCRFTAIDAKEQFRSRRTSIKPSIAGPQTAIVVGPSGEEIHTDEFGRVKVQFHWDRYGKADENSSCWIRVAQVWAGKNWGAMYIPRIGQEVILEFIEGDPDRPIITGRVYNAQAMPPYDLPSEKTKSTLKSNSSKGGQGFNEIRYEDKKGDEQIFMHAEKNLDTRVKNDSFEWIGNERHLIVTSDQFEEVDGDKHLTVKGDQNEKIDGTISVNAGMDMQQKVGMNHALEAGMEVHIKGGTKVIIEAGVQLSMKAGSSFVDIGPAGVSISGPIVMINSGGAAGAGSGCSPDAAKPPKEADTADPGEVSEPPKPPKPPTPVTFSSQALVQKRAAEDGTPFCEQCEAARKAQSG